MRLACSLWNLHSVSLQMFLWLSMFRAQSPELSATALDSLLQDYAFRAFHQPRTGIPYNGHVPSNLTGIEVAALRLRSGSLRKKGFESYREFYIPIGVVEQPYVERLVLVYHNLANWSSLYYPLPGYTYLGPVLGLLAYNASNLSATDLPELDIRASQNPILIKFLNASSGLSPKCVYFGLDGSVEFNNVLVENVCSTFKQGHFSIVVESTALPPAPAGENPPPSGGGKKVSYKLWMWISIGFGGLVLLVSLCMLVVWVKRCRRRKRIQTMEQTAEGGVTLQMKTVGNSKAPMALATRTRPLLESEHVN
uniref:Non-specific serine/threonine protein kinase n=1 Tax=Davidia involucrata TaxID=16924 RepID=A0A5B6ZC70_DAVIN